MRVYNSQQIWFGHESGEENKEKQNKNEDKYVVPTVREDIRFIILIKFAEPFHTFDATDRLCHKVRHKMRALRHLFLLGSILLTIPAFAQTADDRKTILAILSRQSADWNVGRVDRFMGGYWPSDSLTFVGKAGLTYGYTETLANYKKRYPNRASMGTLKFDILQLDFPARNVAYVIGHWHLTRPQLGDTGGHFTLLWRKLKKRWVIVSDHSS